MPLPSKPSVIPDDIDPRKTEPGLLVQRLISRGVLPHSVVDFPRLDDTGQPVARVHVRLLTVSEQDKALANARLYVERLLASGKKDQSLDWRPEELEHNARITELLATACREPSDPSKMFFTGAWELREHCTPKEIGILSNVYAKLADHNPRLGDMTDEDIEAFLRVLKEGTLQDPFSYCSRDQLETLLIFCVKCLDAPAAPSTGPIRTCCCSWGATARWTSSSAPRAQPECDRWRLT